MTKERRQKRLKSPLWKWGAIYGEITTIKYSGDFCAARLVECQQRCHPTITLHLKPIENRNDMPIMREHMIVELLEQKLIK